MPVRLLRCLVAALALWLLGGLQPASAADAVESASLGAEAAIRPTLPGAALWSLTVIDLATGRETVRAGTAHGEPMLPGSLVKLLTAGALLDQSVAHGVPDLRSTLSHDGVIKDRVLWGNLYLTGRGNPFLSSYDLNQMVGALAGLGVERVAGNIVADASLFDPRGLERKRSGPAYAEPGALGLELHTAAVTVTPAGVGDPPTVTVNPVNDEVRSAVDSRTVDLSSTTLKITRLDDLAYRVTGSLAKGAAPVRMRFPLREPALYAAGTLRTLLAQKKIAVSGTLRQGTTPEGAALVAEIPPPPLDPLLREMSASSLNVVADNLLLALGRERFTAPGTRDKGLRAVRDFLEKLGVGPDGAVLADGSGLSGENRLTTVFLARYLYRVAGKGWFERFSATLPRPGDGTLREVGFSDERFRAKTGTLEDAYALAGYGVDRTGKPLAFAFIVNHPGAGVLDLKRAGTAVMRYLSTEVSL